MGGMSGTKEFEKLKKKYPGVKLAEFLIVQYCKDGNFYVLGEKYNASHVTIRNYILKCKDEIIEEKPYMWEMYEHTVKWNKANTKLASKRNKVRVEIEPTSVQTLKNDDKTTLTSKTFKQLPKKIHYRKLVDWADNFKTGALTGNDLIRMANEQGIKVFERYKGRERFLIYKEGELTWTYCSN